MVPPSPLAPSHRTSLSLGSSCSRRLSLAPGSRSHSGVCPGRLPHSTQLLPLSPALLSLPGWLPGLHLNLEQRSRSGVQPALLKHHPCQGLSLLRLPGVFAGFLRVYSLNPDLVPWKQDLRLLSPPSTSLARNRIWHTVGNFVYLWKERGRKGISKFSFSLKKLPKVFLEHIKYLRIWVS